MQVLGASPAPRQPPPNEGPGEGHSSAPADAEATAPGVAPADTEAPVAGEAAAPNLAAEPAADLVSPAAAVIESQVSSAEAGSASSGASAAPAHAALEGGRLQASTGERTVDAPPSEAPRYAVHAMPCWNHNFCTDDFMGLENVWPWHAPHIRERGAGRRARGGRQGGPPCRRPACAARQRWPASPCRSCGRWPRCAARLPFAICTHCMQIPSASLHHLPSSPSVSMLYALKGGTSLYDCFMLYTRQVVFCAKPAHTLVLTAEVV